MKGINHGLLAPLGMVGLTILAGAFLISNKVNADDTDVVDQVNITVPTSCTMSGTGMNSHTANINNNTYTPNIGTTTLHAFCNDNEGFAIYAIGYTDDEFGKNVLTSSTLGNTYDIVTGTAESGSTSNWAMKLAITQDSGNTTGTNAFSLDNGFGSYRNVPAEYTKAAHKNSATDMTANTGGVELTTTYAAFTSKTQPAGTYVGQVKYTLVHPVNEVPLQPQVATPGCINYFPNGGNVEGTMGCQTISASATSATLLASNFSREGYGFAGWSTTYDYSDDTGFLGPQEDITFTAGQYTGTNNGLSLYARWIKSAGNLQGWTGCSTMASGAVTALTDQRDGETYAVAKLADGKCWMIENLRLESTSSDNSTGTLAEGYGTSTTYGNFGGLADAESTGFTSTYTANSLYYSGTQEGTASINIGTTNYPIYRMPRYNHENTNSRASNPTTNVTIMYSYGNYYTWHAAIADLTYNGTNNQSTTGTSLCPAGWHLPTGGMAYASGDTSGVNVTGDTSTFREFYNLGYKTMNEVKTAYEDTPNNGYAIYSSNTTNTVGKTATAAFRSFPNNFLYSGYFSTSSGLDRGRDGYYWSSTVYDYDDSCYLGLHSLGITPGTYHINKITGLSVRCIAGL